MHSIQTATRDHTVHIPRQITENSLISRVVFCMEMHCIAPHAENLIGDRNAQINNNSESVIYYVNLWIIQIKPIQT